MDKLDAITTPESNTPWPDHKDFGGLTLDKEYGNYRETSYIGTLVLKNNLQLQTHISFNDSLFRNNLQDIAEARMDIIQGKESRFFNPPILAIRVTDRGNSETEIFFIHAPKNTGITYELRAIDGRQTSVSIEEWKRPSQNNGFTTPSVEPPTKFTEEEDHDENNTWVGTKITITDDELIKMLDQLGLPTIFWSRDESEIDLSRKPTTIKPFPEILKGIEDLISNIAKEDTNRYNLPLPELPNLATT